MKPIEVHFADFLQKIIKQVEKLPHECKINFTLIDNEKKDCVAELKIRQVLAPANLHKRCSDIVKAALSGGVLPQDFPFICPTCFYKLSEDKQNKLRHLLMYRPTNVGTRECLSDPYWDFRKKIKKEGYAEDGIIIYKSLKYKQFTENEVCHYFAS